MDFVHVHDIARANILAAKSDVTDEVFNVASGTETSLRELARTAGACHGLDRSMPQFMRRRGRSTRSRAGWPTPSKARDMLGFEAEIVARGGPARPGRLVARMTVPQAREAAE